MLGLSWTSGSGTPGEIDGAGPQITMRSVSDSGSSSSDTITNETLPTWLVNFAGTGGAIGDDLEVVIDDDLVSTVSALTEHQIGGGPMSFGLSPIADGAHEIKLRLAYSGGGYSNYGDTLSFTIDTTAPTLSSATGTSTGETTATVGVTTNEGSGTLYVVVTDSATPPSGPQVIAGTDDDDVPAPYADDVAVTTTGAKSFNASALNGGGTYYAHFAQTDSAGNVSSVASTASFTLDAGTTPDSIFGSDLLIWCDASVQYSASQWDDQSGNGRHLVQATAGNQPTANANGLSSGKPALVFAFAGPDSMQTANTFDNNTDEFCVIMVMKTVNDAGYSNGRRWAYSQNVFDYGDPAKAYGLVDSAGTGIEFASNGVTMGTATIAVNTPVVTMEIFDGAFATLYVNNVAGTPVACTNTFNNSNKFAISAAADGAFFQSSGTYSELIVAKNAPDAGQRTALQSYLATKWGI